MEQDETASWQIRVFGFAILALIPVAPWWKALNMMSSNEPITRYGGAVSPDTLWLFAAVWGVGGGWAIYKVLTSDLIGKAKDAILPSLMVGILFFGTASGVAKIAQIQSVIIGESE